MPRDIPRPLSRTYNALSRAASTVLDGVLNVDTTGGVDLADLGLDAPDRVSYRAGGWLDLLRVLRPGEVGPGDAFLDLGSGKGRMLLLAARYPFRRIIGVELSESLTAIARRNLARSRLRPRCRDIELVTGDALDFAIPDDITVVYLFNPFRDAIFDGVVRRLEESVDRRPRSVRVIYRNPIYNDRLLRSGRFRTMRVSLGLRPSRAWRERTAVRLYVLEPHARENCMERSSHRREEDRVP
jgi:SAM-dependent methyltransferase